MKKFMIFILMLIPLVILVTTSLASSIIAANVFLTVDSVKLNEHEVYVNFGEEGLGENVYDGLKATVYPLAAKNKEVTWHIDDVVFDDPDMVESGSEIASVDENGVVKIFAYGMFTVVVTTVEGSKTDSCVFTVGGNNVTSVRFDSSLKKEYLAGETTKIDAIVLSVDAVNKNVIWSSSDESIFKVSANGIITAVAPGEAVITAVSEENPDAVGQVNLVCVDSIFKHREISISSSEFRLADVVFEKHLGKTFTFTNCLFSDGKVFVADFSKDVYVSFGDEKLTVKACAADEIKIEHAEYFSAENFYLRTGGAKLNLKAVYVDTFKAGTPDAEFFCNAANIAEATKSGVVIPKMTGEALIEAKGTGKDSGAYAAFELKVVFPVTRIALSTDLMTSKDKTGIAQERVFGNKYFSNGEIVNYTHIKLFAPVGFADENADNFIWSTSDETIAYFENPNSNKLIFSDKIFEAKTELKITVKARFSLYESVPLSTSYAFKLANAVNVDSVSGFEKTIDEGLGVVLHGDIALPNSYFLERRGGDYTGPIIRSCLYGNGRMISRALTSNRDETIKNNNDCMLLIYDSNVVIENLTARFGLSDDKDVERYGVLAYEKQKAALNILAPGSSSKLDNISIKYCIFENAFTTVVVEHADVKFEGCIFRNAPSAGLLSYSVRDVLSGTIAVKNCVFSNTTCVPICIMTSPNVELNCTYDEMLAQGVTPNTFEIEGFLDIYNWMSENNLSLFTLPQEVSDNLGIPGAQALFDAFMARELKTNPLYKDLKYSIDGKYYYHAGILLLGGNVPCDKSQVKGFAEAGYIAQSVPMPGFIIAASGWKNDVIMLGYNKENYEISPSDLVDYSEDSKLYEELRSGRTAA